MIPDVSVIIAAYNTENFIKDALNSALNQTHGNIEVIVVDDASQDRTLSIIGEFNDPRLKVFSNKQNQGVSASRNRALQEAKGEWVAVLDSDDWYAPERLEKLLEIARNQGADIIADDLNFISSGDELPWSTLIAESGEIIKSTQLIDSVYFVKTGIYGQRGLHLGISKPIFRRDFLLKQGLHYDETLPVVEDFTLLLECLIAEARFLFVPFPFYFYRARPGSLVTQSKVKHIQHFMRTIRKFLSQEKVRNNAQLTNSLTHSLKILERYHAYYIVVEFIKQKKWLQAMVTAISNPQFFLHFFAQLPAIIWRRIQYYLLGNKVVFQTMYQQK